MAGLTGADQADILISSRQRHPCEVPLIPVVRTLPQNSNLLRLIAFGLILVGFALTGAGCIFSPPKDNDHKGGGGTPQYPALDSPNHVLEALTKAYAARDTLEYKALYDSTYTGTSQDLNDPPGSQVSTFKYADEIAHMAALQRVTTISSIFFDLGNTDKLQRLQSSDVSHPEYAEIQINSGNFRIEIYDGPTLYSVQSINPITFVFIPTVAAPGDTTWKIVQWVEVGQTTSSTP